MQLQQDRPKQVVLFGGNEVPKVGLHSFITAAGGPASKILLITWATYPTDRAASLSDRSELLKKAGAGTIIAAPLVEDLTDEKIDHADVGAAGSDFLESLAVGLMRMPSRRLKTNARSGF